MLNSEFANRTLADFESSYNDHDLYFYSSILEIRELWDSFNHRTIFLKSPYLSCLELNPPSGFEFRYCLVRKSKKIVGIIYYQIRPVELAKNFQDHGHGNFLVNKMKKIALSQVKHQMIICGNVLLTGPYGFDFNSEICKETGLELLKKALQEVKINYNLHSKKKIKTVLYKDFDDSCPNIDQLGSIYHKFSVQPSMAMNIPGEWSNFEDYLLNIKSKYKVRVRRAIKKFVDFEVRLLKVEEVNELQNDMNELFLSTAAKADFSLFEMHSNYFYALQEHLGNDIKTYGVFKDQKLAGFYTLIIDNEKAEAHFLGYDMGQNKNHQVYLNMLYSMVEKCIELRVTELSLSRTALEIKSSIGAKPINLNLYINYDGDFMNKRLGLMIEKLMPQKEWLPRNPFK